MRELELRLLRTTFLLTSAPPPTHPPPPPLIDSLLSSIKNGNYNEIAAMSASGLPFDFAATWKCAGRFYEELERKIRGFVEGLGGESEEGIGVLMCVGVAACAVFYPT